MLKLGMARKAKTRAESKAQTSEQLVKVARKFFYEYGYAKTSMDGLAEAAGVTRGAIYHNFGGKKGLFEAVVRRIDGEILDALLRLDLQGKSQLEAFITTCITYFDLTMDDEVLTLLFREAPAVLGQRLRDIDAETSIAPLSEAIAELISAGVLTANDPESLAVLLNGAMSDAVLWISVQPKPQEALQKAKASLVSLILGLKN